MKLPELKRRFKNKYVIRIAAGVLTVAVAGGSFGAYTVQAEKAAKTKTETTQETADKEDEEALEEVLSSKVSNSEQEVGKEETVYVVADNTGKADTVIVSDWLKNPEGKDTIEDASDLKDIKNVKGKEKFEEKDGKLTWKAKGNDIYYQGTTDKEIPVKQTITYYLDGEKMDPEDIAGKSGKVTIRFDYKNNEKTTVTVDGKKHNVYVPFTVLTGMVLNENYTNVEVKNGKVISDGDKQMVVGVAMPGLKSSLQVNTSDFSEDVEIPEYIEVTADVKDFELDMTMSVMMSGIATGDDIEDVVDLSDLDDAIDTLSDSSSQLVDGTKQLRDGLTLLKNSAPALASGADTLNSSTGTLRDGIAQLDETLKAPMTDEAKAAAAQQAADTVAAQKGDIEKQAAATVAAQKGDIEKQAAETVNAQADAIKQQAAATVNAQSKAIAQQAVAAVEAQFADDTNPQSTKNLSAYAAQTFYDKLTSADSIATVKSGLTANGSLVDSVKTSLREQVAAVIGDATISTMETSYGMDRNTAVATAYNQNSQLQAGVAQALGLPQAISDYATLEGAVVDSKLSEMATTVLTGIASNAKTDVGASVAQAAKEGAVQAAQQAAITGATEAAQTAAVTGAQQGAVQGAVSGATEAAKTAAVTGAKQGAAQGAVAGAEAAKAEVLAGIETKQANGFSLVSGMEALKSGTQALADQVPTLLSGVNQLADGAVTLNDGMIQFDEEGIQKLADTYNGDVKGLMEKVVAVMQAGSDYQTFSDKSEDTVGEVKFVIRTEGVEVKED